MLTRKNEDSGDNKRSLLLIGTAGVLLLLIFLAVLAGSLAETGDFDPSTLFASGTAVTIPQSMRTILEDQARLMGLPFAAGSQAFWFLARAGGIVSYLLLWLATCWGIMMSSKVIKGYVPVPAAFALHQYLPILGVVFAALHALILLGDTYIGFNIWQLLIPFSSTYEPLWTGLGSLAFYISLALVLSFTIRKQIGSKVWRAFHYTAYLGFLLALLHGVLAGSDSKTLAIQLLYLFTGATSLFLLYYRLVSYMPRKSRGR